jgi:hypothetical protein
LVADDALAAGLGRNLVATLAPAELPLFDQTWQALGRNPGRRGRRREEPLGFGLPEASEVLVTAVASGVVTSVLQDLGKDFGSRSVRMLARIRLARIKGRPAAVPDPLPPLPAARLRQIRQTAFRKARKLGMPEAQADALADALISDLVTRGAGSRAQADGT